MRLIKFDTEKVVCYHEEGDWHEIPYATVKKRIQGFTWSADTGEDPGTQQVFLTTLFVLLKRKQQ